MATATGARNNKGTGRTRVIGVGERRDNISLLTSKSRRLHMFSFLRWVALIQMPPTTLVIQSPKMRSPKRPMMEDSVFLLTSREACALWL